MVRANANPNPVTTPGTTPDKQPKTTKYIDWYGCRLVVHANAQCRGKGKGNGKGKGKGKGKRVYDVRADRTAYQNAVKTGAARIGMSLKKAGDDPAKLEFVVHTIDREDGTASLRFREYQRSLKLKLAMLVKRDIDEFASRNASHREKDAIGVLATMCMSAQFV